MPRTDLAEFAAALDHVLTLAADEQTKRLTAFRDAARTGGKPGLADDLTDILGLSPKGRTAALAALRDALRGGG